MIESLQKENSNSIFVETQGVENLNIRVSIIEKILTTIIKKEKGTLGNISVIFCSDDKLLSINQDFLGHDTLTDIITFDYCHDFGNISGDIFISLDRVKDNAELYKIPLEKEICRVVAHGVLHLLGYDDHSDEEIKLMRQKEEFYLKLVCSDV